MEYIESSEMGGEFSRVESKMGETWSDGGHPLLGCVLPVTVQRS